MNSNGSMLVLSKIVYKGLLMEIDKMRIQLTKMQKIDTKKIKKINYKKIIKKGIRSLKLLLNC